MYNADKILLRRKHLVVLSQEELQKRTNRKDQLVASITYEAMKLGYAFSSEIVNVLTQSEEEIILKFHDFIIPALKEMSGADVEYRPMYPNFPRQVMEMDDVELFLNAIYHYLTGENPRYIAEARIRFRVDPSELDVLNLGTDEAIALLFKELVSSKTNLSDDDKADMISLAKSLTAWPLFLPEVIPLKENVALITKLLYEERQFTYIFQYLTTAADVLRFIVALSNGDISLAEPTKFSKMKRPLRRLIMDLLANCGNIVDDMARYQGEWIRIGEIIHPGEFGQQKYNVVRDAFKRLREDNLNTSFLGKVEAELKLFGPAHAAGLLQTRPGEFARQLHRLLRMSNVADQHTILRLFEDVAAQVSLPVLLQVHNHFRNNLNNDVRLFFPKGQTAHVYYTDNTLPPVNERIAARVVDICGKAMTEILESRPSLGKVYVDHRMSQYAVPTSQRSASSSKKPIARGSRIKFKDDSNFLRGFIWWTNTEDCRVDIDLSAVAYDENWEEISHCSYTNLGGRSSGLVHSGDITNGGPVNGKGAAEFLDIDVAAARKRGIRYITFQVHNYTGQEFNELPNCRFGWMERKDNMSGEIFEPSTVKTSIDLTTKAEIALPVIFDLETKEAIWCDIAAPRSEHHPNNLESNLNNTTAVYAAMVQNKKPNLGFLCYLNAMARGKIVNSPDEADIIFSPDEGVTPNDFSFIMGNLL